MIFSAIRNWLGGYTSFQRAQTQIEERYLGDSDLGQTTIEPKLTLNAANNDVFRRYVIDAIPLADIERALKVCKKEDRNKALLSASLYLNQRIKNIADKFDSPDKARDYFLSLVQYITDTVQIVRLVVRGDDAAYTIFETLNDRGMELAPLDLVKNYLFSRAEKSKALSLRDLEERWTEMMTLLSSVKADSFLRAFWTSKHGAPEGKRLFGYFKKEYADAEKAYQVSLDMRAAAERYAALSDSNDPIWSPYSERVKHGVEALAIIGSSQFHPLILAALAVFDKREFERLMWLLEVLAVRWQLVARGRPGRIESTAGRAAKAIADGKITTASQVLTEVRELYIADPVFEADFKLKTEREAKKAMYLLKGLEHQSLLRAQDAHPSESIPGNVTVEHILPKSPGAAWKAEIDADPELHADFLYRLGNMCLLADANRALGNKAFSEKKKSYAGSKLRITNSVSQYANWTRNEIEDRQSHLAQLAVAKWRFQ
ncbi:MAG: DUF262 domain-containing protein [Hyphomicrobiales bacterium]|nr:DUF262 domain-containing protein [Hyphomicrobiales bacterium]